MWLRSQTRVSTACLRLKVRIWRVSAAARSAALRIASIRRLALWSGAQLPRGELGVAEDHAQEVVEVVGDAAGELPDRLHLLGLQELLLGAPVLDELADLAADRGEHGQQLRLGLAHLGAQEVDHARDFAPKQDRKAEGAAQPGLRGRGRREGSWHLAPRRARRAACRSAQTRPGRPIPGAKVICRVSASRLVRREPRHVPEVRTAQHVGLTIDLPDRTELPARRSRRRPG